MNTTLATPSLPMLRRSLLLLAGAGAFCVLLGWLVYLLSFSVYVEDERHLAARRLEAFALSLEATLSRHESLPGLLALDSSLTELLREPDNRQRVAAANAYLEAARQRAEVAVTYLMDDRGKTLAASNWRLPGSFVGHNYAFRPYFLDALKDGLGRFYAIGVTTGEPGYFLAAPIGGQDQVLGVIVVKVGLESIEQAMAGAGDTLLLADADGVAFLSSEVRLRYRTLAALTDPVAARLRDTRKYGSHTLAPLARQAIPIAGDVLIRLALPERAAREYLITTRPVGQLGWHVVQLGDPGEARGAALSAALAVAFCAAFALGLAAHFRHRSRRREELRRVYTELEGRIAERTLDLTAQIAALESTKAILRETRDAAVQAGKLTVLGQMSAGVSHELNQPLAALQTFADNARALLARGRHSEVAENLQMISELVDRTGRIVRQLKIFSRKDAPTPQPVLVVSAIENALMIVEPRRRETAARIDVAPMDGTLRLIAEAGRLEQVLVNLLRNGLDAIAGQTEAVLELAAWKDRNKVIIQVRDHGAGLPEEVLEHLFEAFYTTKPAGEGLGIGLVISLAIVESYGGTLAAHNALDGGAIFVVTLPAAAESGALAARPHA